MPEYSDEVAIMWSRYLKINKGCESVGYAELVAYGAVTGEALEPWESDLMIDIDMMRRSNG